MSPEDLKAKGNITREDIAALLASVGAPGKHREEKLLAIRKLGLYNSQRHALESTLETYKEW